VRYPRAISGSFEFATLSAGRLHSCGVTTAAEAYCWGISLEGQLGDGATSLSGRLGVLVSGGLAWAEVVAAGNNSGGGHTCGLTSTGDAYCWGGSAELGDGTALSYTPTLVSGGGQYATITAKGGGRSNAHSCALTTDGDGYCWGGNGAGQIGDATNEHRPTPAAVVGGHTFTTISAGGVDEEDGFTCATAIDGNAYCWGRNGYGQLGDGTFYPKSAPVRVGRE
jgi:alpha-tubulin suppressor-like RCC1 family protein